MVNYKINELSLGQKGQRTFQFEFQHQPENGKEMTKFIFYLTEEELVGFTQNLITLMSDDNVKGLSVS